MDEKTVEALRFYNSHTAQIELVRHDRTLEQVRTLFGSLKRGTLF